MGMGMNVTAHLCLSRYVAHSGGCEHPVGMPLGMGQGKGLGIITFRGNHLSSATCLTHAFFKIGQHFRKVWWSLTRRKSHKANEARIRQVASDKQCHPIRARTSVFGLALSAGAYARQKHAGGSASLVTCIGAAQRDPTPAIIFDNEYSNWMYQM